MTSLNNTPAISVVIPTYNRAKILDTTLHCLTRQTLHRKHFEVIVVDDGSCDETRDVVDSYRDKLSLHYLFQKDKGFRAARARNLGASEARGKILVFNDDDIAVNSKYLEAHLNVHQESSHATLVRGLLYGYPRGKPAVPGLLRSNVDFRKPESSFEYLENSIELKDPNDFAFRRVDDHLMRYAAAWRFIWGSCISLPRKAFFAAGQFDEKFSGWGGEDLEFAYRCHLEGMHFALERRCWVVHQPASEDLHNNGARPATGRTQFIRKFRRPEIELYTTFRRLQFCLIWEKVRPLVEGERTNACSLTLPALPQEPTSPKDISVLVVGCGDGAMFGSLMPRAATELNRAAFQRARSAYPAIEIRWAVGVSLPWGEKSFAKVIITEHWRELPQQVLIRVLIEACRVGKLIQVVCGGEQKPDRGLALKDSVLISICRRLQLPLEPCLVGEKIEFFSIKTPEKTVSGVPLVRSDWPKARRSQVSGQGF